jgi:hypothetical protein
MIRSHARQRTTPWIAAVDSGIPRESATQRIGITHICAETDVLQLTPPKGAAAGHRCQRGRRHPRSAAVRMIGKRGASAVAAPVVFQCTEPRKPRLAAELLPRCVRGMAGESPRRRDKSVSITVQLMNVRRASEPVSIASRGVVEFDRDQSNCGASVVVRFAGTYECGVVP